eukprot:2016874-Amphidinium_carterae.2
MYKDELRKRYSSSIIFVNLLTTYRVGSQYILQHQTLLKKTAPSALQQTYCPLPGTYCNHTMAMATAHCQTMRPLRYLLTCQGTTEGYSDSPNPQLKDIC